MREAALPDRYPRFVGSAARPCSDNAGARRTRRKPAMISGAQKVSGWRIPILAQFSPEIAAVARLLAALLLPCCFLAALARSDARAQAGSGYAFIGSGPDADPCRTRAAHFARHRRRSCRHPPSLHRSDADISPATAALRPQQLLAPASTTKTQITQHGITVPVAPTVLKTTVAALAQPSLPIESQKSDQTPALNLHSLTPPPVRTPPAVSSLEAFRTPASVPPLAPAPGRHPKTLNRFRTFARSLRNGEVRPFADIRPGVSKSGATRLSRMGAYAACAVREASRNTAILSWTPKMGQLAKVEPCP